jgi:DNA-binding NarL/FixJ family response regulator
MADILYDEVMMTVQNYLSKILIIDDHQIYLDGLEMLLKQALSDVAIYKASTLEDAKSLLTSDLEFDLILLDIHLNNANGFDLCELDELKHQPIAILSASEHVKDIQQAHTLGLLGFLNKATDNEKLIDDIQRLLKGECIFPTKDATHTVLTPRQQDVLNLLSQGYPNKVICKQLSLSEATVKTHLRALFNILDVHTRTQCVSVAREKNLI